MKFSLLLFLFFPILMILQMTISMLNLLISALPVLAYLEIHLTHFLSFALKEALKIVILMSLFLSYPL